jgi:hypothetical protein
MIAIVAFEGVLVAGGSSDSDAAVWTSTDLGETWSRSDRAAFGGSGLQIVRDIVVTDTGLLAVGSYGLPLGQDAAVWTSSDGRQWGLVDDPALAAPDDQEAFAARVVDDRVVVVGITNEFDDIDGAVWLFEGGTWSRVSPESFAEPEHQVMLDVGGGGGDLPLVIVGCEDPLYRCDTQLATNADALVWTSEDGTSWTAVAEAGRMAGPGDQVMRALVTYQGALVAVGSIGGSIGDIDGGVWTSTDGVVWVAEPQSSPNVTALGGPGDQSLRGVVAYRRRDLDLIGLGVAQQGAVDGRLWGAREVGGEQS